MTIKEDTDPKITEEPSDIEIELGGRAVFTVEAENVTGYQWRYSTDNGTTWKTIYATSKQFKGMQSKELSFVVDETNSTYLYMCLLSGTSYAATKAVGISLIKEWTIENVTYTMTADNQSVAVVAYKGSDKKVIIPQQINVGGKEYTVTEIGEAAFAENTILESIDLPDTITIIRKRAFWNCTNLKEMN